MRRAYRVALPLVLVILAALAALPPLSGGCSPRGTAPEPAVAAATSPASPAPRPPEEPPEVVALGELGFEPVKRPLRTGEAHRYRLDLAAGDYARLLVEQLGADVTVDLEDPGGRLLIQFDTPTFAGTDGDEDLHVHARKSGAYGLVMRATADVGRDSAYRARLVVRRPATAVDRQRVRAEEWYHRGYARRIAYEAAAAEALLARAARAFAALGDDRRRADAEHERCQVLLDLLGRIDEAVVSCRSALAVYEPIGPAWRRATIFHLLGRVYTNQGDPARALGWYRRSLPLKRGLGDPWSLALLHDDLGRAHRDLRAYHEALTAFDEALAIWRAVGDDGRAAGTLHVRGQTYLDLGRPAQAAADFREALALGGRGETKRADALVALGLALIETGQPRQAVPLIEEALEIHGRGGDRGAIALTLTSLGLVRGYCGQEAEAAELYRRALPLAEAAGDRRLVGHIHHNLAWMAAGRGSERAIPLFRRALHEYRVIDDRQAEVRTLLGLARAERARGRFQVALDHLERALLIVGDLRDRLDRHDLRITYMARRYDLYDFAVELLMDIHRLHPRQGWDARALEMSGRARARGLLDLLNELGIDPRRGVDADLLRREEELQGRRFAAAARLRRLEESDRMPATRIEEARRELQEISDRLRNLGAELRRRSPAFASLAEPEVLDVAAVQSRLLDTDTVLLEYKLGDERSHLWAVGHDSLESFDLPGRAELAAQAMDVHEQVGRPPRIGTVRSLERSLADLSRALLCPARERLDRRRLIVVAEGELLYVPFAALSLEPCGGPPMPLAAGHEIVTAPSASALAALHRRPQTAPSLTLAMVANPVFSRCDPRLSPTHRAESCQKAPSELGYSGEEAKEILNLVPPSRRIAAVDFDAQRRALLDGRIGDARYLHLATHIVTREVPARVALSRVDRRGRPLAGGGDLFAHEIAELDLEADLVVLSGCDSGLGESIRGEGLVGLAQGFFQAGAGGVLVTLWPVDDRATASLMTEFYRLLLVEGLTPAAALAHAQQEISRQPRWQAPYYWAGFVLIGDGEPARGDGGPARRDAGRIAGSIARR
jgi:CHAT domain-containing protein/Tfp pilus assembly protein PilF